MLGHERFYDTRTPATVFCAVHSLELDCEYSCCLEHHSIFGTVDELGFSILGLSGHSFGLFGSADSAA